MCNVNKHIMIIIIINRLRWDSGWKGERTETSRYRHASTSGPETSRRSSQRTHLPNEIWFRVGAPTRAPNEEKWKDKTRGKTHSTANFGHVSCEIVFFCVFFCTLLVALSLTSYISWAAINSALLKAQEQLKLENYLLVPRTNYSGHYTR